MSDLLACARARRLSDIAALTMLVLGCCSCASRGIPGPAVPNVDAGFEWEADGKEKKGTGQQYCDDVEKFTRRSGARYSGLGWTFSILGAGAATTPAAITAASGDNLSDAEKVLSITFPVLAGLFAAGAVASFARGDHANVVSKLASLGAAESDSTAAATVCTKAIADWNGARGEASKAIQQLEKNKAEADGETKKELEETKEQLEAKQKELEEVNSALKSAHDKPEKDGQATPPAPKP